MGEKSKPKTKTLDLDELIVKRYALATGRSEEEARAVLSALKERRPDRYERIKSILGVFAEYGDKVKDPVMLTLLRPVLAEEVTRSLRSDDVVDIAREASTAMSRVIAQTAGVVGALKTLDTLMPEQVREKADVVSKEIEELKKKNEELMAKVSELLEEKKTKELEELKAKLDQQAEVLAALAEEVKKIKESPPTPPSEMPKTVHEVVKMIDEEKKKAIDFLKRLGYSVKEEKELTVDEIKKLAEKYGLRITEAKIPIEEYEKRLKEIEEKMKEEVRKAYEKGKEDAKREFDEKMLDRQIKAAENIAERAIDRLISEILGPILRAVFASSGTPSGKPPAPSKPQVKKK